MLYRPAARGVSQSVYLKCCTLTVPSSLAGCWPTCLVKYISEDDPVTSKKSSYFSVSKPLCSYSVPGPSHLLVRGFVSPA